MFSDDVNYAFLAFLYPILTELNRVNKLFESKDADPTKLNDELLNLIDLLVNKIKLPTQRVNIFTQNINDYIDSTCNLGYRFNTAITKLKEQGLKQSDEKAIRQRFITFVANLINEVKVRLTNNVGIMRTIKRISVDVALNPNKEPITDLIKYFNHNKSEDLIAQIDDQWYQIHTLKWNESKNTKKFWYEVLAFKDAQGQRRFKKLASFAMSI